MNIVFLTMANTSSINNRGIYSDLMRKFSSEGHKVYIVSARERRCGKHTGIVKEGSVTFLGVRTLNLQKTNVVEKGLGQLSLGLLYKRAIRKYLKNISFDLIVYSTPPITLAGVVENVKKHNPEAVTYLLLKDIFPQNAVDLGMMEKKGIKGCLYRYFRHKEQTLYARSDYIGCMSPANVNYLLRENPLIPPEKVEVAPNSIELVEVPAKTDAERNVLLVRYGLPTDKKLFVYGGNLGKPQGVDHLIRCMDANKDRADCHFVIVGGGVEYPKLEAWIKMMRPSCVSLLGLMPKQDYDEFIRFCDVGLIFLDYRFTIPNYPSRILSYLENKMPVIVCSDPVSDAGYIAEENGYGLWVPSNDVDAFTDAVNRMLSSDISRMGENGFAFLKDNYLVDNTYDAIVKHVGIRRR